MYLLTLVRLGTYCIVQIRTDLTLLSFIFYHVKTHGPSIFLFPAEYLLLVAYFNILACQ